MVCIFGCKVPPSGIKAVVRVTDQVRVGERAGSRSATKSYTALVIDSVV